MNAKEGAMLVAEGLRVEFGGFRAVDGVSLAISPGETLGIVGESGSGKSTTLRLLLRLLKPDAGAVWFDGVNLQQLGLARTKEFRRRVQLVPQNPQTSLNPKLTIGESIEFTMIAHGVKRARRIERTRELLDRVALPASFVHRRPKELSGGQLQRVAIARALATSPDIVICDEAVSALDKSIQAQILNLLYEIQRDSGTGYVFVSHDLAVVEHISDRIAVMYKGAVVESGPAQQIWHSPQHAYTQRLLDSALL